MAKQVINVGRSENDILIVQHISGGTLGLYNITATCSNGSASIHVRNNTSNPSPAKTPVLKFILFRAAIL